LQALMSQVLALKPSKPYVQPRKGLQNKQVEPKKGVFERLIHEGRPGLNTWKIYGSSLLCCKRNYEGALISYQNKQSSSSLLTRN
jgi:hypothetical protein